MVARQLYHPYGTTRYTEGTLPTDFGFTGQRKDSYIDMIEMGARWYDPYLGRWASADTIVPDPANPQNLNRYSYVLGNPLKYRDPSGHCIPGVNCPEDNLLVRFRGDWSLSQMCHVREGSQDVASRMAEVVAADQARTKWLAAKFGEDLTDLSSMSSLSGLWGLSPEEIFQAVLGGTVTFVEAPQCPQAGCLDGVDADAWAWSRVGALGEVWVNENALDGSLAGYTGFAIEQNTAHELGHGIDQRGGERARSDLAAEWATEVLLTRAEGGFATGGGWQQSDKSTGSEVFADMFLGWTYGQWGSNRAGVVKSQYMNVNMPDIIALAVANNP